MKLKVTPLMIERVIQVTLNWSSPKMNSQKDKLQRASNLFAASFGSGPTSRKKAFFNAMRELGFDLPEPATEEGEDPRLIPPMLLLARDVKRNVSVLILNTKGGYVILDKDKPDTYDPDEQGGTLLYNKENGLCSTGMSPIPGINRGKIYEMLTDFCFDDKSCGSTTNVLVGAGMLEVVNAPKVIREFESAEADSDEHADE